MENGKLVGRVCTQCARLVRTTQDNGTVYTNHARVCGTVPASSDTNAEIDRALLLMIVKNCLPFNIVSEPHFQAFVRLLNPSYCSQMPGRVKFSGEMLS